jgi:hypothetical protein
MGMEIFLMIIALISATTGIGFGVMMIFIKELREWGVGKLHPYIILIGGIGSMFTFMYFRGVMQREHEKKNPQEYELIKYEVYKKK